MGRALAAVTGVILSLVLGGCGATEDPASPESAGESGKSAGESPSKGPSESATSPSESATPKPPAEPSPDVSKARLPRDPFCDSVDKALVADLLGLPVAQVKLVSQRRVGEKFIPYPGQAEQISTVNNCLFGTPDAQLIVAAAPGRTAAELEQSLMLYRSMDDPASSNSDVCAVADEPSMGDRGALITCEGNLEGNRGQASVLLMGLLDGGSFSCQAVIRRGSTPERLAEPTRQACSTILQTITRG